MKYSKAWPEIKSPDFNIGANSSKTAAGTVDAQVFPKAIHEKKPQFDTDLVDKTVHETLEKLLGQSFDEDPSEQKKSLKQDLKHVKDLKGLNGPKSKKGSKDQALKFALFNQKAYERPTGAEPNSKPNAEHNAEPYAEKTGINHVHLMWASLGLLFFLGFWAFQSLLARLAVLETLISRRL